MERLKTYRQPQLTYTYRQTPTHLEGTHAAISLPPKSGSPLLKQILPEMSLPLPVLKARAQLSRGAVTWETQRSPSRVFPVHGRAN